MNANRLPTGWVLSGDVRCRCFQREFRASLAANRIDHRVGFSPSARVAGCCQAGSSRPGSIPKYALPLVSLLRVLRGKRCVQWTHTEEQVADTNRVLLQIDSDYLLTFGNEATSSLPAGARGRGVDHVPLALQTGHSHCAAIHHERCGAVDSDRC